MILNSSTFDYDIQYTHGGMKRYLTASEEEYSRDTARLIIH